MTQGGGQKRYVRLVTGFNFSWNMQKVHHDVPCFFLNKKYRNDTEWQSWWPLLGGISYPLTGSFLVIQWGSSYLKLEVLNNRPFSLVPSCNERWPWRMGCGCSNLVQFIWGCLKQLPRYFCVDLGGLRWWIGRWFWLMSLKWKALIKLPFGAWNDGLAISLFVVMCKRDDVGNPVFGLRVRHCSDLFHLSLC